MRVLKINRKDNFLDLMPQCLDDLWHLEKVLEQGDLVTASTTRKIKPKEPGAKPFKQKMILELEAREIVFSRFEGALRISGLIVSGKPEELIELKAHHTLNVEPGTRIKVKKKALLGFHLERLKKAEKAFKKAKVLIVLLDDERADIGLLGDYGLEEKVSIASGKSGKRFKAEESAHYFQEIFSKIIQSELKQVVVAGPGFTKNSFKKFLEERKPKDLMVSFHATNSIGRTGFNELLKKGVAVQAVEEMEIVRESKLVEKLLQEIGREGLAAYGFQETKQAIESGAVACLLLSEKYFLKEREKLEPLMDLTEKMKGSVHIVSSEHEAGKQLENLGGVAAILRFKV